MPTPSDWPRIVSADWDCASDNLAPRAKRQPGSATMALINAVVWLIVFPVFFVRGLRNGRSTTGDDAGQEADGGERAFHDGLNITGAERDHG